MENAIEISDFYEKKPGRVVEQELIYSGYHEVVVERDGNFERERIQYTPEVLEKIVENFDAPVPVLNQHEERFDQTIGAAIKCEKRPNQFGNTAVFVTMMYNDMFTDEQIEKLKSTSLSPGIDIKISGKNVVDAKLRHVGVTPTPAIHGLQTATTLASANADQPFTRSKHMEEKRNEVIQYAVEMLAAMTGQKDDEIDGDEEDKLRALIDIAFKKFKRAAREEQEEETLSDSEANVQEATITASILARKNAGEIGAIHAKALMDAFAGRKVRIAQSTVDFAVSFASRLHGAGKVIPEDAVVRPQNYGSENNGNRVPIGGKGGAK